ncbi:MAG: multicopper oxidase family protein [Litoreibacter sp.]|nr:multicopper oxidase family protein [Litoreibacter sp.]
MKLSRRQFLAGSAAASLLPVAGHATSAAIRLEPAPSRVQLAPPGYSMTDVWSYNGTIPGQTLRFKQGDRLRAQLVNGLDEATTIHWHGLRLPNNMDGVPGFSQPAVQPGETFDYEFDLPDAGTYWYHPHAGALEQVARGLSGPLIIEETTPPDVDSEHVLVLDDWRMTEDAQIHESFESGMDLSHAGRLGNYVTVNGSDVLEVPTRAGERMRLRLINTATARIFSLEMQGIEGWVVALDGMPLDKPEPASTISLATAQRVDLIVDVTAAPGEEAYLVSQERGEGYALTTFKVASGSVQARREAPAPLQPNVLPEIQLKDATIATMLMEGGAMRGMDGAVYKGEQMDMRALMQEGQFWAFNGVAGMPDDPLVSAALGETVRVALGNDTRFDHAIHLHGHHFRDIRADGTLGPLRDTILVPPGQIREIAFVADNPGKWMFHCHMLSHQISGMMTWIDVA